MSWAERTGGAAPGGRQEPADLIVTANGPGEISGWLFPVAAELRRRLAASTHRVRLFAWAPPCNFASGRELDALRALGPWDGVFGPSDMWRFLLRGVPPPGYRPAGRGLVLFLGGDLFYAAAAARRLRYPALAYTEGRARWFWAYQRFFVPDEGAARRARAMGAPDGRVEVVGDLVVDAVLSRVGAVSRAGQASNAGTGGPLTVGLFAGSRDYEVRWVLPMMLRAAAIVKERLREPVRFVAVRSPFSSQTAVQEGLEEAATAIASSIEWVAGEDWTGVRRSEAMARCDVAISVPGTVTAELGALGVPTVTILPLHRAELVPLEGVPGLIGSIPFVGPRLKAGIVRRGASRIGPISIPSRRAGRMIGPQIVGQFGPEAVAQEAMALLQDAARRRALSGALRQAMGPPGAARRIANEVLSRLGVGGAAAP
ncbi:MAG: hypothetical protein AB1609_08965 [Bacillota bacterium]